MHNHILRITQLITEDPDILVEARSIDRAYGDTTSLAKIKVTRKLEKFSRPLSGKGLCVYLVGNVAGLKRHIEDKKNLGFTKLENHIIVDMQNKMAYPIAQECAEKYQDITVVCGALDKVCKRLGYENIQHIDFDGTVPLGQAQLDLAIEATNANVSNIHFVWQARSGSGEQGFTKSNRSTWKDEMQELLSLVNDDEKYKEFIDVYAGGGPIQPDQTMRYINNIKLKSGDTITKIYTSVANYLKMIKFVANPHNREGGSRKIKLYSSKSLKDKIRSLDQATSDKQIIKIIKFLLLQDLLHMPYTEIRLKNIVDFNELSSPMIAGALQRTIENNYEGINGHDIISKVFSDEDKINQNMRFYAAEGCDVDLQAEREREELERKREELEIEKNTNFKEYDPNFLLKINSGDYDITFNSAKEKKDFSNRWLNRWRFRTSNQETIPTTEERVEIYGDIADLWIEETMYGDKQKMEIQTVWGWTVSGSVPVALRRKRVKVGDFISLSAKIKPMSQSHGIFQRPSRAKIINPSLDLPVKMKEYTADWDEYHANLKNEFLQFLEGLRFRKIPGKPGKQYILQRPNINKFWSLYEKYDRELPSNIYRIRKYRGDWRILKYENLANETFEKIAFFITEDPDIFNEGWDLNGWTDEIQEQPESHQEHIAHALQKHLYDVIHADELGTDESIIYDDDVTSKSEKYLWVSKEPADMEDIYVLSHALKKAEFYRFYDASPPIDSAGIKYFTSSDNQFFVSVELDDEILYVTISWE